MNKVCFPYTQQPKASSDDPKRPYVFMELQAKNGEWFKVNPLADTGADITVFPRGVCEILGNNLRDGKRLELVSATHHRLPLFIHTVHVRIGTKEFDMDIGFTETHTFPHLLGRKDLLDHFDIKFSKSDIWFIDRTENNSIR